MTLSLCILFSCVARRLGLILTPVPATVTGGESCLPCQLIIGLISPVSRDIAAAAFLNTCLPDAFVQGI